jgi:hypothetical protein
MGGHLKSQDDNKRGYELNSTGSGYGPAENFEKVDNKNYGFRKVEVIFQPDRILLVPQDRFYEFVIVSLTVDSLSSLGT